MIKLFALISQLINFSVQSNDFNETYFKHMNTKSDYNLVANIKNFDDYILPECKQIGFWHLIRNGAKNPNYENIEEMNSFLNKLKDTVLLLNQTLLDKTDMELLEKWTPRILSTDENLITKYGNQTIKSLAQRYWSRLKYLISETRILKQVKIQSTEFVRTRQTAEKYIEGMFKFWPFKINVESNPIETDFLLKYPDLCDKYLVDINSNQFACSEALTFDFMSFKLRNLKKRFQNKIGVTPFFTNIDKAFEYSYKMCQSEYLLDKTVSVWCKFFDLETIKLLEYKADIKYNCKYGFKFDISRLMSCDLINDLIESLNDFKKGDDNSDENIKKIKAYFTHSDTILTFLASMGLGKSDENFDYENIISENVNRKYKTSNINPTSSNIGFLLYKCKENSNKPKYLLRVFLNEFLIKTDGCQSSDCDLTEFLNYFEFYLSSCKTTKDSCKV